MGTRAWIAIPVSPKDGKNVLVAMVSLDGDRLLDTLNTHTIPTTIKHESSSIWASFETWRTTARRISLMIRGLQCWCREPGTVRKAAPSSTTSTWLAPLSPGDALRV